MYLGKTPTVFKVTNPIILKHLFEIHEIKKLDKLVPPELTDSQKMQRIQGYISLQSSRKRTISVSNCDMQWKMDAQQS